ncbi:MAG: hypothetical protein Sapg2KO_44140 [Saprospiraceae bacterium]
MKGFKIIALFLCLAIFTLPAMANTTPEPDGKLLFKTKVDGKSVIYRLSNLQKMDTQVAIYSMDEGTRYYRKFISNHNGYVKRLDLEQLPNGKYKMVVYNGEESKTKVMKIEEDMILFSK